MASATNLPPPPVREPITGADGLVSSIWNIWFIQFYTRVGGAIAPDNTDLAVLDAYEGIPQPAAKSVGQDTLFDAPAHPSVSYDQELAWLSIRPSPPTKLPAPRVIALADATSFTPNINIADINTQTNTQALGTLTANAPTGAVLDGQAWQFIIKSTNAQTFSWNAAYAGGTTTALPTASTGGGKIDRFFFQYNAISSKWEITNAQYGY